VGLRTVDRATSSVAERAPNGAKPPGNDTTAGPETQGAHTSARRAASLLSVPITRSDARAVFGSATIVAEYVPAGHGGPQVVLYTEGVARTAEQQGLPAVVVEQRAIAHELLHHAAASLPPGAKRARRRVV